MLTKRIILLLTFSSFLQRLIAQERISEPVADYQSLQLYNEEKWKDLLEYGKNTITSGTDFSLLRMRTGYAAFKLHNYSQSLLHYQQVLDQYPENETALYYVYLNHLYLNNTVMARYYSEGFSEKTQKELKIKPFRLSAVQVEYSYIIPQIATRGNAQYGRVGIHLQLGKHIELQQSAAFFNQRISEANFTLVTDNTNIAIQQKEYYAKLLASVGKNLVLIGGFHYQYSPFNNLIYKNTVAFGGIKYYTPYAHFQAMAHVATLANKQFTQFDGMVTAYPFGNTNLYSITRVSYGNQLTLTQMVGVKVVKGLWAEANVTLGSYDILLENDGLYIYNDVDTKQLKASGSIYASLSKNLTLSLNYTFEQKLKIYTTCNFLLPTFIKFRIIMEFLKKLTLVITFFSVAFTVKGQTATDIQKAFNASYTSEYKGNYTQAIEEVKKAYKADSYECNLRLGWLYYNAKNYASSMDYYQKAIDLKKYSVEARMGYIKPANAAQKYDKAFEMYEAILKIDPYNSTANYWVGVGYYTAKKYDAAAKYFELVANMYPFDYDANHMLGWSYLNLGRTEEARVLFTKALLNRPGDKSASDGLAKCRK